MKVVMVIHLVLKAPLYFPTPVSLVEW